MADIKVDSLAVRYRPSRIEELIGNAPVKQMLAGFLAQKRFPNALLIVGGTGLGKTTMARMIARYVSCKTNDICMECQSCKSRIEGTVPHPDISEINMGDARGIDTIRELSKRAEQRPMFGNTRVIILDEVHAITSQAASALLKTLEEPSANTMFILATTDPHKVLPTIVGRCKKLTVMPPTYAELAKYLARISKREGVVLNNDHAPILRQIYDISGGHVRNAIQMLESLIAMSRIGDLDISMLETQFMMDADGDSENIANDMIIAVLRGDAKQVIKVTATIPDQRAMLHKAKFLIDQLLNDWAGASCVRPVVGRFNTDLKKAGGTMNAGVVLRIGQELARIEQSLNSGISDSVIRFNMAQLASQVSQQTRG